VVAVSIIITLMALVVVLSKGVVKGEEVRLTRSTITALEAAIDEFEEKNGISVSDALGDLIKGFDADKVKYIPGMDTTGLAPRDEYFSIEALALALTTNRLGGPFIELDSSRLANTNKNYYDADDNDEFEESKGDIELFEVADAWGEPFYFDNQGGKGGRRHQANLNERKPDIWSAGPDHINLCRYEDSNTDGKFDEAEDRGAEAKGLSTEDDRVVSDDVVNWE